MAWQQDLGSGGYEQFDNLPPGYQGFKDPATGKFWGKKKTPIQLANQPGPGQPPQGGQQPPPGTAQPGPAQPPPGTAQPGGGQQQPQQPPPSGGNQPGVPPGGVPVSYPNYNALPLDQGTQTGSPFSPQGAGGFPGGGMGNFDQSMFPQDMLQPQMGGSGGQPPGGQPPGGQPQTSFSPQTQQFPQATYMGGGVKQQADGTQTVGGRMTQPSPMMANMNQPSGNNVRQTPGGGWATTWGGAGGQQGMAGGQGAAAPRPFTQAERYTQRQVESLGEPYRPLPGPATPWSEADALANDPYPISPNDPRRWNDPDFVKRHNDTTIRNARSEWVRQLKSSWQKLDEQGRHNFYPGEPDGKGGYRPVLHGGSFGNPGSPLNPSNPDEKRKFEEWPWWKYKEFKESTIQPESPEEAAERQRLANLTEEEWMVREKQQGAAVADSVFDQWSDPVEGAQNLVSGGGVPLPGQGGRLPGGGQPGGQQWSDPVDSPWGQGPRPGNPFWRDAGGGKVQFQTTGGQQQGGGQQQPYEVPYNQVRERENRPFEGDPWAQYSPNDPMAGGPPMHFGPDTAAHAKDRHAWANRVREAGFQPNMEGVWSMDTPPMTIGPGFGAERDSSPTFQYKDQITSWGGPGGQTYQPGQVPWQQHGLEAQPRIRDEKYANLEARRGIAKWREERGLPPIEEGNWPGQQPMPDLGGFPGGANKPWPKPPRQGGRLGDAMDRARKVGPQSWTPEDQKAHRIHQATVQMWKKSLQQQGITFKPGGSIIHDGPGMKSEQWPDTYTTSDGRTFTDETMPWQEFGLEPNPGHFDWTGANKRAMVEQMGYDPWDHDWSKGPPPGSVYDRPEYPGGRERNPYGIPRDPRDYIPSDKGLRDQPWYKEQIAQQPGDEPWRNTAGDQVDRVPLPGEGGRLPGGGQPGGGQQQEWTDDRFKREADEIANSIRPQAIGMDQGSVIADLAAEFFKSTGRWPKYNFNRDYAEKQLRSGDQPWYKPPSSETIPGVPEYHEGNWSDPDWGAPKESPGEGKKWYFMTGGLRAPGPGFWQAMGEGEVREHREFNSQPGLDHPASLIDPDNPPDYLRKIRDNLPAPQQPIDPGGIPPGPQPEGDLPYGVHPESAFEEWGGREKAYGIINRAQEAGFPVVHAFEGHGPDHVRKAMDYLNKQQGGGVPLPGEDGRLPGGGQPGGQQGDGQQVGRPPVGGVMPPPPPGGYDKYPEHWGQPTYADRGPLVKLPGNYGWGQGTTVGWIQRKMEEDAKQGGGQPSTTVPPVKPPGNQPDDFKKPFATAHPKAFAKEQQTRRQFVKKYGEKNGMKRWRTWSKSFRKRVTDAGGWQDPFEPPSPQPSPQPIPDLEFFHTLRGARR